MNIDLPKNEETETWLIGSCFHSKVQAYEVLTALQPSDFYFPENKKIFETIVSLYKQGLPIDSHRAVLSLKQEDRLDYVGGASKVLYCANSVGSGIDTDFYIHELKKLSISRQLIESAMKLTKEAHDSDNIESILQEHQKSISQIGIVERSQFHDLHDIGTDYRQGKSYEELLREEVENVRQGNDIYDGFRSGFPKLDMIIGGFGNGTQNIIGARSSSGKTTFLINLFCNISRDYPEARMGFFSLEMPKHKIFDKLLATKAGISPRIHDERTLTDNQVTMLIEGSKLLKSMNLGIYDCPATTVHELCRATRRSVIEDDLKIIFIDYLSRIQGNKRQTNKHLQIDEISKALQNLALELNIPIVTLCQLNRNVYGRESKIPVLGDLRESGSIEEDADLVLMLHRPAHWDNTVTDNTHVIVAKNRIRGDLGKTEYKFNNGLFEELQTLEEMMQSEAFTPPPEKSSAYQYLK